MAFNYQTLNSLTLILIFISLIGLSEEHSPPKLNPKELSNENRKIIKTGSSTQLHCPIEKSQIDDIYFEWNKDGNPIEYYDERFKQTNNGVLKIRNSVSDDTGRFTCKAINGFGSVEFSITLIVMDDDYDESLSDKDHIRELESAIARKVGESGTKPQFVQLSKFAHNIVQRQVKSSIKFRCAVSGEPKPIITWYHNNQLLTDSESKRGRFSLVINDLKSEDSGNYTCISSNPFGTIAHSYILQVVDNLKNKPDIQGTHPINTTVILGNSATFECRIKSDEKPHIQWLKRLSEDDMSVTDEPHFIKVQGELYRTLPSTEVMEISEQLFFNQLVINNAREADTGKYLCLGANSMGSSFKSAFLSVLPSKPQEPQVYSKVKHDIFPIPIWIAFVSIAVIISLPIIVWIFLCFCQKQEPETHTNQSSYHSAPKHSRSSQPSEQNTTHHEFMTNKYHNIPSKELRASSPFYNELMNSDKHGSNVYQLYTNPADMKQSYQSYQSYPYKTYGHLC